MTAVVQRPSKGSRRSYFYPDKSLPSLSSLDSAFQLQEYISLLIRLDIHDVEAIVSVPDTSSGKEGAEVKENGDEKEGEKESKSDFAVDKACWIYEQLRRLAQYLQIESLCARLRANPDRKPTLTCPARTQSE